MEDLKPQKANYNREEEVIQDIFRKKCVEFWNDYQVKEYLVNHYGYTEQTAQKYNEKMWKKIKESVTSNYEDDLAQTVNYMSVQIQNEPNSFVRLQWIKELNKIKGLQKTKIEIDGQINHIEVIRIKPVTPASIESHVANEIETPSLIPLVNREEAK